MKNLSEAPYTQREADAAAGMGSYVAPKPMTVLSMEELHALRTSAKSQQDGENEGDPTVPVVDGVL